MALINTIGVSFDYGMHFRDGHLCWTLFGRDRGAITFLTLYLHFSIIV